MDISVIKTKLDKLCQCGICLELLKQPKILSCQHTFCQKCLMLTCTENRMGLMSLFCPSCRQRQPLVFQPVDVLKLQTPFFVNQVIEILQEWPNRLKGDTYKTKKTGTVTYPDFLNTKITSVFKSINADTLEEMTQIRTDEYGVQSIKMKKLKDEIERSRKTNSDLMIDNFIMKTRLDNEREPNTKQTIGSIDQKLRNYMSKRSTFRCNDEKSRNLKEELIEISSDLTPHDSKSAFNLENKNDNIKNNWKHIEGKPETDDDVELLVKKSTTLTNGSTDDGVPSNGKGNTHIKPKTINIFCWRCMRRGHVGNACNESTTLLGRMICGKCNLVGHETESCKYY